MPRGGGAAQGTAWEPETELPAARGDFLLQAQAGCEVAVGSESGPAACPPCRPPTAWGGKSKFARGSRGPPHTGLPAIPAPSFLISLPKPLFSHPESPLFSHPESPLFSLTPSPRTIAALSLPAGSHP